MWELDHKEGWALKNGCFLTVVLENTLESPLDYKKIKPVHSKGNQSWIFIRRTDEEAEVPILLATWGKGPTHYKRPWCWERLKAGGEGDDRRWDGWMASPTQRTWVWSGSRRRCRTLRPGMLQSMGLQSQSWTQLSKWTTRWTKLSRELYQPGLKEIISNWREFFWTPNCQWEGSRLKNTTQFTNG